MIHINISKAIQNQRETQKIKSVPIVNCNLIDSKSIDLNSQTNVN